MRLRSALLASAVALLAVACGFGVDLGNLFDGPAGPSGDGGNDGQTPVIDGSMEMPDSAIPKVRVSSLQVGDDFACALRVDGTVMCWGYNDSYGQLGTGAAVSSSVPVLVKDLKDAKSLSVGRGHACAVRASGAVVCWGANADRQLGDGTTNGSPTPVAVVQITDATQVSVGVSFGCVIRKDGSVACWGDDTAGQLGDGVQTTRSQPAPVMGVANVVQLATAYHTACALTQAGDVYCWGDNAHGQVGIASPAQVVNATKVAGLVGIKAIGSGSSATHFCAVGGTGSMQCWGEGGSGQLGNGATADSPSPVPVTSIDDAVGVTSGSAFTCAWRKSGAINCWGTNGWRQLGVGDTSPPGSTSTPLPVSGINNAVSAAAGGSLACAVQSSGDHVSCWGSNISGSLGRATLINSPVPVQVKTAEKTTAIATGAQHGCAIGASGGVACWGMNDIRELGSQTILGSGTPIPVPGLTGGTAAAAGEDHACALLGTQVQCWGHAAYGQMGNGTATYVQPTPVVFNAGPVTAVGAGYNFTCVLLANGQIACSGLDYNDQLGRSGGEVHDPQLVLTGNFVAPDASFDAGPEAGEAGPVDSGPPIPIPFGSATKIAIGRSHSCAIHNGVLACWGDSSVGQCGSMTSNQTNPNDIALPSAPIDMAPGGAFTCVVLADNTVRCFGQNDHGQLGGAGSDGPALRTPNLNGKKATAITAGYDHACALISDGTVMCWGAGAVGQIGSGILSDTPTPTAVSGLSNITAVRANERFTCALAMDGSVKCWGNNQSAQLGNGTILSTGTPAPVAGY